MGIRSTCLTAAALLLCVSCALHAQDPDADVLSAAIAHYSDSKSNPLLVIAGETIEVPRIVMDQVERSDFPDGSAAIVRELRERNAKVQPLGDVRLPTNAVLVRDALSLIRRFTQTGAELSDWSPFTHAYPGSQLLQLAVPAYFTRGQKALVYFSTRTEADGRGWIYILEKRGAEWHVTSSQSPWGAASFAYSSRTNVRSMFT